MGNYKGFKNMNIIKQITLKTLLVSCLAMSACASSDQMRNSDVYDPYEPYNRAVFAFNDGLDYVLLNPITEVYRFVIPGAFRTAIANVLNNIKSPVYLANELLQGDLDGAALVTKRFVFNTFTGFGGILDTASWEGMTYEPEDFGQTLATWGVGTGGYFVLPIFGPSSVRDTFGMVGDMAMDPINWYAWNNDKDDLLTIRMVATGLTAKDQYMDLQKDLKRNSLDYYAATRSVWAQRRQALIKDGDVAYDEYD